MVVVNKENVRFLLLGGTYLNGYLSHFTQFQPHDVKFDDCCCYRKCFL